MSERPIICYQCPFNCQKGLEYKQYISDIGPVDVRIVNILDKTSLAQNDPNGTPIVESSLNAFKKNYEQSRSDTLPGALIRNMTSGNCPISQYYVDVYVTKPL